MLFIHKFRVPFILQFNISCSPLDTLLRVVSSGSFSSIATWLSPTPFPHPARSPGPFGRPRKKLHSQQTPSTDRGKCHSTQSHTSPRHLPDASPTVVRPHRLAEVPLHGVLTLFCNGHRPSSVTPARSIHTSQKVVLTV